MDRGKIREIAERMAEAIGVANITRERLCSEAGIPEGSFTHIMGESFTDFITCAELENSHRFTRARVAPEFRRQAVLESAIMVAQRDGWQAMTRGSIAELSCISAGLVSYVLGDMSFIREMVLSGAIGREIVSIVAEALTAGDPMALNVSKKLRLKVNKYIARL
jgi:DNA-binding transcriptional regulator YbjK